MGLFDRRSRRPSARPNARPPGGPDAAAEYDRDYEPSEHQTMAIALIDAFWPYDLAALAALTPAQRAVQLQARWALYEHVDAIWEDAKNRGLNPAILPEWNVVAGLRDLTAALHATTMQAQAEAGDED